MLLDSSIPNQSYIEDCEVCCNPIQVILSFSENELTQFQVNNIVYYSDFELRFLDLITPYKIILAIISILTMLFLFNKNTLKRLHGSPDKFYMSTVATIALIIIIYFV